MAQRINKSEIVEFFLVEAGDHIQAINDGLLTLEANSEDTEVVDEIFRAAHTIKGSSAMLGFSVISRLAHKMEDLLGKIRSREIKPTESVITLLLNSIDALSSQIENISRGIEEDNSLLPMFEDLYREFLEGVSAEASGIVQTSTRSTKPALEPWVSEEEIPESELLETQTIEEEALQEGIPQATKPLRDAEKAEIKRSELKETSRPLVRAGEKQIVRVNINDLNKLMNLVGALVINRNRLDQQISDLNKISAELNSNKRRLLKIIRDFREKYEFGTLGNLAEEGNESMGGGEGGRGVESSVPPYSHTPTRPHLIEGFSELEFDKYDDFNILSRSLTEIGLDISEAVNRLNNFCEEFGVESSQIRRTIDQLQQGIIDIRMVPVGNLFSRFHRPLRDVSKEEGKEASLVTAGGETKLDKTVIDEIADPLMHLIRNAVSHGIEPPEVREKLSKPRIGVVSLNAYQEGSQIVIEIRDDGGGIDPQKMREIAVAKGIKSKPEVDRLSDAEAIQLMFLPGFSTKEKVTDISGRGVGMDVVKTNISKLNGTIDVKTELGKGTLFLIKLPLTLIIYQALLVRVAGQEFAIPLSSVEETLLINPSHIYRVAGEEVIRVRDQILNFVRLSRLLQLPEEESTGGASHMLKKQKYISVVIVGSAEQRVAIQVEELIGQEVIVIKSLGDYLKRVKMISGATISGEGKVRLILNISHIMGAALGPAGVELVPEQKGRPQRLPLLGSNEEGSDPQVPNILVADDSISIRKVVSHFLSNAGYQVQVANDGLDAWNKLNSSHRFDLLITDLEMPKMHGYELIAKVRNKTEFQDLPIIVLTSRAGQKHYQKAVDLGANEYLVKPFDEKKLRESVSKLLQKVSTIH